MIASIGVAIMKQNPSPKTMDSGYEQDSNVTLTLNDFSYDINLLEDGKIITPGTLNSDRYNTVSIGEYTGYDITINDQPLSPNGTLLLNIPELGRGEQITLKIVDKVDDKIRYCYLNTLPDNYTDPVVISNNPEPGFYYFNLNEYVYKMDTTGKIVFWRLAGRGDISCGGDDFKRSEVDGKTYYTFLYGNETDNSPFLEGVGYGRMRGLVLDEDYKVVDDIPFMTLADGNELPLENHQFTILGDKHYLLTGYMGKRVDNIPESVEHEACGTRVVADIIQEVKDGSVIFEWDSTEHPELYELSLEGNDFYNTTGFWADYAHLNSVIIDSDGNFICSFRNLSTIIKIDRATGDIMWKLGGIGDEFQLTDTQKFSKQHDARVTEDGYITLFNNGNEGTSFSTGKTSVIKLKLNEETKQVEDFQEYSLAGQFSSHMGSAQLIENSTFIVGWGGRQTCTPLFSEIDFASKKVLFEVLSPRNRGDFPDAYKVYKFSK